MHQPNTMSSQASSDSNKKSSFRNLFSNGHFTSLGNALQQNTESQQGLRKPECTYKFLAGFNRQHIQTAYFSFNNQKEAIDLLNEAPQIAVHLMLNEIDKSARNELVKDKNDMFYKHVEQLDKVKESAQNNDQFYHWVVGFDLFADEMGYPYCPFVARDFIDHVREIRDKKSNPSFGLRIHCGENVPIADATAPAYRHFAAHMYIVFRCLRYLQYELEYGIRIGHGIAFQHILDRTMMKDSKHRKSSVLIAEIEQHARHVFKTIAFEVNITSNEYLLGHAIRKGSPQRPLQLNALLKLKAPIILATDNDGIWPILKCPCDEPSHFSLSGEICRAISTKIINSLDDLDMVFKNMKTFRFYSDEKEVIMPKAEKSILPHDTRAFTVIIHPDIIKFIIRRCEAEEQTFGKFYDDFSKASLLEISNNENVQDSSNDNLTISNDVCSRLAPIAYVSYCVRNSEKNPDLNQMMKHQYNMIFKEFPPIAVVLEEWKSVYQQLIKPNIIDQSQCVLTRSKKNVFFSEGPLIVHKDQKRPMIDLIDYLQHHYHYHHPEKIHIHAFTRHINVTATLEQIRKQLKRTCDPQMCVSIYSTKDKDQYDDFDVSEKIQLTINQTPLKRTNFKNEPQQNGLYAVCPHASAATAFLHMVGKELSESGNTPLPIDNNFPPSSNTALRSSSNEAASVFPEEIINETQSSNPQNDTSSVSTSHDFHDDNRKRPSASMQKDANTQKRQKRGGKPK